MAMSEEKKQQIRHQRKVDALKKQIEQLQEDNKRLEERLKFYIQSIDIERQWKERLRSLLQDVIQEN